MTKIIYFERALAERLKSQGVLTGQLKSIARAQPRILAPALEAMRELGLSDDRIAAILERAAAVLRGNE